MYKKEHEPLYNYKRPNQNQRRDIVPTNHFILETLNIKDENIKMSNYFEERKLKVWLLSGLCLMVPYHLVWVGFALPIFMRKNERICRIIKSD